MRIFGRSLMKEFVCNEVTSFQASILTKMNFSTFFFQVFINCLGIPISRNAFLWLLPSFISSIYFSCKENSKENSRYITKFPSVLPRTSKLFVRPHLDHRDIIHDQAYNFAFHQKLESFQYNASLVITVTIRGTGELAEKKSSRNSALNHLNQGDGAESFAALLRFTIATIQTTS